MSEFTTGKNLIEIVHLDDDAAGTEEYEEPRGGLVHLIVAVESEFQRDTEALRVLHHHVAVDNT